MKSIALAFLLFSSMACCSQAYKYRFRIIDLPEAFKNQYITWVDEDTTGMLWFVTNSGLHRYDGNQVISFDMQSTPALPDVDIRLLVADGSNHLWIANRTNLLCFDLQQWTIRVTPFQRPPANLNDYPITALAEGKDGIIYASYGNANLYRVVHDSLEYITHINTPVASTSGSYPSISSIQESVPGYIWLTTSEGQIVSIQHQQKIFAPPNYFKSLQRHNALVINPQDKYVLNVPGTGLYVTDMKQLVATPLIGPPGIPSLQSDNIFIVGMDENQAIFYNKNQETSETGLTIYNAEHNTFNDLTNVYPATLKTNVLRCITSRNDHVLIPFKGGIATLSYMSSAFDMFASSLENTNSIRTIYKEPDGQMLIGSYLHKFIQFDEATSASTSLSSDYIGRLLPWQKDTLLSGMEGGGIGWYLPATKRFVTLFGDGKNVPTTVNPYVICLTKESDTSFWAGTNTGFYLINPYTRRILKSSTQERGQLLYQSVIYDILKVGSSRFFATRDGLFKYNVLNKSWTKLLSATDGSLANSIFSCLRLANNQIWAGTVGNGLLVLDTAGNLLRKLTTAEGLAGNIIFSNPLCKNHLLVGTRTGLSIINLLSGKISNYSSEYYLPANEFNRSAWCVSGDTVYMGTINGFIRIDMNRLQQQQAKVAPDVYFSDFTYSNGNTQHSDYTLPYRKNVSLTIPPNANNFSIGFGGLSEMASGLKLFYRLSTDGPWQEIGQRREVTFVNVAPDKYTMQIAARMPDGRWIENILSLPIMVQPHFYQTWWWKGLLVAAALGLIWLGIKYRERNLLKEQKLRSRIAGDLHDEVGSALTRIYFQAGMLTASDETAAQPTVALLQIASSSQEALSSMSDMVWSIDAHYDTAPEMVGRMKDYIARLQEELDCHCTFSVSGSYERLRLSQVVRQNILLIFKEAINNALKYGNNKTVAVHLLLNEHALTLDVINKLVAASMPETTVQGGHGLKSMQLRADKIKAKLTVTHTSDEFMVKLQAKPF